MELRALVAEAQALAGEHPCRRGHTWEFRGGRTCPKYWSNADTDCGGSQAVFQCAVCEDWDYGEPGGPGAESCANGECRA